MKALTTSKSIVGFAEKCAAVCKSNIEAAEEIEHRYRVRDIDNRIFQSINQIIQVLNKPQSFYNAPVMPNPEYSTLKGRWKRWVYRNTFWQYGDDVVEMIPDVQAIRRQNKQRLRDEWKEMKQIVQGKKDVKSNKNGEFFGIRGPGIYELERTISNNYDMLRAAMKIRSKGEVLNELHSVEVTLDDKEIMEIEHIATTLRVILDDK
jgi:hypothetical protein